MWSGGCRFLTLIYFKVYNLHSPHHISYISYSAVKPLENIRGEKISFYLITGSVGILEFSLIYDEINQLLMVNILRAKVAISRNDKT